MDYGSNRMWEYHVQYVGAIDIQAGGKADNINDTLRLEWNPDKDGDQEHHLRSWLGLVKCVKWELGRVHVTRADWCVDYGEKLEAWRWVRGGASTWSAWGGEQGIETLYLGSPNSDRLLRIYDKARELREKQAEMALGPWWRVEAECRGQWAIDAAKVPRNPFRDVREVSPAEGSAWAMINPAWLERYGVAAVKGEVRPKIGRNAWARNFKAALRDTGRLLPEAVWEQLGPGLWRAWASRFAAFADEARYHEGGEAEV